MICVYPADCSDFSANRNGTLSPLSANVTEPLNGENELELVHFLPERTVGTEELQQKGAQHEKPSEQPKARKISVMKFP